ncbi:hypothetical protein KKG57_02955, partial [Patescibacteria group bacterium]|nr:hypothetical protein [Patescibacteria group bacterium]
LAVQAELLKKICNKLGMDIDISTIPSLEEKSRAAPLPSGAEGWAVVLRPGLVESRPDVWLSIELLREGVSEKIDNRIPCAHEAAGHFRCSARTAEMMERLSITQPQGDVVVIPVQLGRKNAKASDADVLKELSENEFGLSFLSAASVLAVHPERIGGWFDLGMSFPGEEVDYDADGRYARTLLVKTNQGALTLMHFPPELTWMNDHGAATGFVW